MERRKEDFPSHAKPKRIKKFRILARLTHFGTIDSMKGSPRGTFLRGKHNLKPPD
jgi:hypothetical protein